MFGFLFDFRKRFDRWFDPALFAGDAQYHLHTTVIEELIRRYEIGRAVGNRHTDQYMIKTGEAILPGLEWMQSVAKSRDISSYPTDASYLNLFHVLKRELYKESPDFRKAVDKCFDIENTSTDNDWRKDIFV